MTRLGDDRRGIAETGIEMNEQLLRNGRGLYEHIHPDKPTASRDPRSLQACGFPAARLGVSRMRSRAVAVTIAVTREFHLGYVYRR